MVGEVKSQGVRDYSGEVRGGGIELTTGVDSRQEILSRNEMNITS